MKWVPPVREPGPAERVLVTVGAVAAGAVFWPFILFCSRFEKSRRRRRP